ncbi:DUF2125 domain-containing protein [Starkeya koreensis]|uniref:DUF2125 domain-containing protein n=1 Tax=Ancylobacter koreensis TaxID=266121 RepID=A0ABT0DGV2_9HYPH|nr:DUF2125 domain-containing protein [Ancylobacter koreensis]MCK0206511.1 DUF2125 domain-containing protein [Ancylobacter koreensis]
MSSLDRPSAPPAIPARRRPWLIALPTLLVVLAGLGWSAAWFYASGRASTEIDAWMAREAAEGRNWSCASRELGGFPFRFELICAQPSVTFAGPGGWEAKMTRAHAVAQVWNPNHIIAEFEGPAVLKEAATGREVTARWSLLQVSGVGSGGRAERVSISTNDYSLAEGGTTVFAARHTELHVRHHPGEAAGTLDIAFGFKGASGMLLSGAAITPAATSPAAATPAPAVPASAIDGEVEATVTGVPPFRSMPAAQRLALWQQAGGRVDLQIAKLTGGGGALTASGDLGLDAQRRPDGRLNLSLVKAQPLFTALVAAGLMPDFVANLAPALLVAGLPTTVDGQKASSFPFMFRDGRVALGVLPIGKIGPLF